jgi:hypothetical protein
MKNITLLFISVFAFVHDAISQFSGTYTANVNGDHVEIILQQSGSTITGSMKDSQQSYSVAGTTSGNHIDAKSTESSYGIVIYLSGDLSGSSINMEGSMDLQGVRQPAFAVLFSKVGTTNSYSKPSTVTNNSIASDVKDKAIDAAIVGLWREESHYNSSGFSGSTYTYSSFNADHTMSNHGSQATISGADYSGNSGGQAAANVIPNIWYYTSAGKIWVYSLQNGQYTQAELGSYYIENGKMLFTQANTGKKILYYKQ